MSTLAEGSTAYFAACVFDGRNCGHVDIGGMLPPHWNKRVLVDHAKSKGLKLRDVARLAIVRNGQWYYCDDNTPVVVETPTPPQPAKRRTWGTR